MDMYVKTYFGFIRPEYVSFVIDEHDDIVGFGVSMPSLTKALQKNNGKLFPFGFLYPSPGHEKKIKRSTCTSTGSGLIFTGKE